MMECYTAEAKWTNLKDSTPICNFLKSQSTKNTENFLK